jgi:hypothetical protein
MHLDNLLFVLFVVVALLFQVLARAAAKGRTDSNRTKRTSTSAPPPIPPAPVETDEERIRKFLEALGQPTSAKPPPPVVPRTDIPPRPVAPVSPPSNMRPFSVPRWTPAQATPVPKPPPPAVQPVELERTPTLSTRELPAVTPAIADYVEKPIALSPLTDYEAQTFAPESVGSLGALLATSEGLRNAIILREIFGPPRSLQSLDLVL